ncbi:uncharacterized protein MONOS_17619 [Monocercomonoides exilis]|uniref:uncharacterized protein n=1 Tax=Monocercomonoides exilis TaxID=2049356 RepID=UPI00355960ED|nr:hypothetical protein MONOS_17619 [Monocercomonoides exilis]
MQVYVRDEVLTNTKAMQMSVEVLIQVPGRSIDLKRGICVLFPGEWGVCALSGVGGDAGAACVLQPRGTAPGEGGSRSRVQNVREEEKVETPDPFVRTDFKDGRVALMNESRWLNAEDGDSSGLMLTLVALHIF